MKPITKSDLRRAWNDLYRNKPKSKRRHSKGTDGISVERFKIKEIEYLDEIHRQIEGGFFEFSPLKIYPIPRKGKSDRQIQAPTVTDRIVQKVLSDRLMKEFAVDFRKNGIVGSVKGTTVEKTVKAARVFFDDGYRYILKTDIRNYFPSIDKKRMKKKFYKYVSDKELRKFFDDYMKQSSLPGIPQGTPLSPFMANLYLFDFDKALMKTPDFKHFRYIDDLLIFCKEKRTAEHFYRKVKKLFKQIDLDIHPFPTQGKTDIDIFDNGRIDVLGVIYRDGKFLLKKKKIVEIEQFIASFQFKACLYGIKKKKKSKIDDVDAALTDLLKDLDHKIKGLAAAYKFCDVRDVYRHLDQKVEIQLKKLFNKLHLDPKRKSRLLARVAKFSKRL